MLFTALGMHTSPALKGGARHTFLPKGNDGETAALSLRTDRTLGCLEPYPAGLLAEGWGVGGWSEGLLSSVP